MSSFKTEKQKERKLKYLGNFPIDFEDRIVENDTGRDGCIKTDQLIIFKRIILGIK